MGKKILSILLTGSVVLLFVACGRYEPPATKGDVVSGSGVSKKTEKLPMDEEKQFEIIAKAWQKWDLSWLTLPSKDAEDEEKMAFVDNFEYSVTDLDQDGYMEIMTFDQRGTSHYTEFHIYEVKEDGSGLTEWKVVGAGETEADWLEYPMEAYYDTSGQCWHYFSRDHVHETALTNYAYRLDLAVKDNQIQITMIGSELFETDENGEYQQSYYDESGKEIDLDSYDRLKESYYQEMEPFLMFYNKEKMEYDNVEEVGTDVDTEEIAWDMEDLWAAFEICVDQDTSSEVALTESEKKQLRTIAGSSSWYTPGDEPDGYSSYPLSYMVTDLDGDGQLEIIQSSIQGSGKFSYTEVYEVSKDGKKLKKIPFKDYEEGTSSADISAKKETTAYWDSKKKIRYFLFEDFIHISAEENYKTELLVSMENDQWVEGGYPDGWQNMKKETVTFGWKESCEGNLYRMNEDYLYARLVESYGGFQVK